MKFFSLWAGWANDGEANGFFRTCSLGLTSGDGTFDLETLPNANQRGQMKGTTS